MSPSKPSGNGVNEARLALFESETQSDSSKQRSKRSSRGTDMLGLVRKRDLKPLAEALLLLLSEGAPDLEDEYRVVADLRKMAGQ